MPIVLQLILNFPQRMLPKELAALAVNLTLNPRNAQLLASQRGLQHLVDRVRETKDSLLMKARGAVARRRRRRYCCRACISSSASWRVRLGGGEPGSRIAACDEHPLRRVRHPRGSAHP